MSWAGYTDEYYQKIVEQRFKGERIDRVTTGGNMNQFIGSVSGGRIPMINNQLGQYLPLINPEPRQQMSGLEQDYAYGLADVRFEGVPVQSVSGDMEYPDHEVVLHSIIPHYRHEPGVVDVVNGESVVYRTHDGLLAIVEIPNFYTSHSWSCATLHKTDAFKTATPGDIFGSSDVIAQTNTRTAEGNLAFGRELNWSYLGWFSSNEDGSAVSKEALPLLESEKYEATDIFLQADDILLPIHGDGVDWQALLSPGNIVPENGMIAATRKMRKSFSPVNMMKRNLRIPQHPFDLKYRHAKGSEIVEVEVLRDNRGDFKHMPKGQVAYLDRLADNCLERHRKILEIDALERRNRGPRYDKHPSWHIAVVQAEQQLYAAGELPEHLVKEAKIIPSARPTIQDKTYTYYIRIVSKGRVKPTLGHKLTGMHGEKTVICATPDPEEMPLDKWGRRGHINVNPAGVSNRNNPSQLIEGFRSDACYHTRRKLLTISSREEQLAFLLEFYRLASLESYRSISLKSLEEQYQHLDHVLANRIDLVDEPGDPGTTIAIVDMLEDTPYYPPRDHVTYRDHDGTIVTSHALVRVSNKYTFTLDKIGKYSSACNIALRQYMGFTAKLSAKDKATTHISTSASRLIDNTTTRALFGNLPSEAVRYMLHSGNSIKFNKNQLTKFLQGELMLEPDFETQYVSRGLELFTALVRTFGHDLDTDSRGE